MKTIGEMVNALKEKLEQVNIEAIELAEEKVVSEAETRARKFLRGIKNDIKTVMHTLNEIRDQSKKIEKIVSKDRRKDERVKEYNEVTISVISPRENIPKEKFVYNLIEDISKSGAKIRSNILLPVNTLVKLDFTLETLQKQITAVGKVKWIKVIIKDKLYNSGVELVDTPSEATHIIMDYIAKRKKLSDTSLLIHAKIDEPQSK
ncbi:MAG: PilZ domain-containing protein [Syntrophaceae bacterium]|nr:PilZ domain-containing protein [Syntrophaceae bacterium]